MHLFLQASWPTKLKVRKHSALLIGNYMFELDQHEGETIWKINRMI